MIEIVFGVQTSLELERAQELVTKALAAEDPGVSVEVDDWSPLS